MNTHTQESQASITPENALELLKEGNARFVNNQMVKNDFLEQVKITSQGQYPFATILSCIDSRVPAEIIFDQGIGDIFSIRIAGNILNEDILGSMEFACKAAGSKLILVLGHTRCGAVKGAIDNVEMGNLTGLLKKIAPAIELAKSESSYSVEEPQFMNEVVNNNTVNVKDEILEKSEILNKMVQNGELAIVKGVYEVETGEVILI